MSTEQNGPSLVELLVSLRDADDMPIHHSADIDQWLFEASDSPVRGEGIAYPIENEGPTL